MRGDLIETYSKILDRVGGMGMLPLSKYLEPVGVVSDEGDRRGYSSKNFLSLDCDSLKCCTYEIYGSGLIKYIKKGDEQIFDLYELQGVQGDLSTVYQVPHLLLPSLSHQHQ